MLPNVRRLGKDLEGPTLFTAWIRLCRRQGLPTNTGIISEKLITVNLSTDIRLHRYL